MYSCCGFIQHSHPILVAIGRWIGSCTWVVGGKQRKLKITDLTLDISQSVFNGTIVSVLQEITSTLSAGYIVLLAVDSVDVNLQGGVLSICYEKLVDIGREVCIPHPSSSG